MLGRIDYLLALNISKSISRSIETTPNSFFPTLNLSFLSFFVDRYKVDQNKPCKCIS